MQSLSSVIAYAIHDLRSSPDHPLGDAIETFIRREDAKRFVAKVRGDDPELASYLRIEERELEAGRVSHALVRESPDGTGCISRLWWMSAWVVFEAVEASHFALRLSHRPERSREFVLDSLS